MDSVFGNLEVYPTNYSIKEGISAPYCEVCKHTLSGWLRIPKSRTGRESPLELPHHHTIKALLMASAGGCGICVQIHERLTSNKKPLRYSELKGPLLSCRVFPSSISFVIRSPRSCILDLRLYSTSNGRLEEWSQYPNLAADYTGDFRVLERAKAWLLSCTKEHTTCLSGLENPSYHPPRLLQIVGDIIKLRETTKDNICGPYITLSYCWGRSPRHLTLSSNNLGQLRHGIAISVLARTFREACKIAKYFDVEYIWIDSLCIMQHGSGSKTDWQQHLTEMRTIYSNCWLNIAADHGEDAEAGCFAYRDPDRIKPCLVQYWGSSFEAATPSEMLSFSDGAYFQFQSWSYWTDALKHSPLMGRGWVIQERLLSPRVLHFGREQLLWECNTRKACETTPYGFCDSRHTESIPFDVDDEDIRATWEFIVRLFSAASLTNSQDKLPAIAGVAEKLCVANNIGYVAGILDLNLDWGLMWSRRTSFEVDSTDEALVRISDPYIAPTWSWASYQGPIMIAEYDDTTLCKIEDVRLEFIQPDNIYGQLKSGFIAIAAVEMQVGSGISNWDSTNLYAEAHDISLRTSTRTHRLAGTQMRLILDEVCLTQDLTKATFAIVFGGIDGGVHGLILAPPEGIKASCWVRLGVFRLEILAVSESSQAPSDSDEYKQHVSLIKSFPKTKFKII